MGHRERVQEIRRDRSWDDVEAEEDYLYFPSAEELDPTPVVHEGVEALRARLITRNAPDWMLEGIGIYERAFQGLYGALLQTDLPPYLNPQAFQDLFKLAQVIQEVMCERIRFKHKHTTAGGEMFEGYPYITSYPIRAKANSRLESAWLQNSQRKARPAFDININDLQGQNHRGKAIAAGEDTLRCSFKAAPLIKDNLWTVSIDHGYAIHDQCGRTWKIIRPLSQAIKQMKEQGFILSGDGDVESSPYTYHYIAPESFQGSSLATFNAFKHLNYELRALVEDQYRRN